MEDDFNSSDLEFTPPAAKSKRPGRQKVIEKIIANAAEDRIFSKKAVKTLQFGRGAPGYIDQATMWVERFNTFRQVTLRQSLKVPFTGDDLIRFMESIIGKLDSNRRDKPAPSEHTAISGFIHLSNYGDFTYDEAMGYKLTGRDRERRKTWIDDAVKAGRLTRGRWSEKVWLNFTIVSRMAKAWLDHYESQGAQSWDLVIAKLLSIILVSCVGMRPGDVARSLAWEGKEYVKFEDVRFEIRGDGKAKLENIEAAIKLKYVKGKKDIRNDDRMFYVRPLKDPNQSHMCVISLILIHALRHGMVRGSTIQEVLDNAVRTADSRIVWLYPQRPVLAAIQYGTVKKMDLDKPTTPQQLDKTIKHMGLVSNILTPVSMRALRNGSAQDVAHLPRMDHAGFTDNSVRQALGHSHQTFARGVTDDYVGDPTRLTYNDRAANQFTHSWGPKFSEESALDFVYKTISEDEIAQWLQVHEQYEQNEGNVPDRNASSRARAAIRAERHQEYISKAPPIKTSTPSLKKSAPSRESAVPISLRKPTSGVDTSNIDSRLLCEDGLDAAQVNQASLDALRDHLLPTNKALKNVDGENGDIGGESSPALESLLRGDLSEGDQQLPGDLYNFITHFSKINVVNCTRFAVEWAKHHNEGVAYEDSVAKYSVKGNSRDLPTPMLFHCKATPGCPYSSFLQKTVNAHEALCTPEYVAREVYRSENGENFTCEQCDSTFLTPHLLKMHIKSIYDFEPIPCPHGCEPDKVYTAESTLNAHKRREHSGVWPARCRYPGCTEEKEFKSSSYANHLTKVHDLKTSAERRPWFPPTMKRVWQPTRCPVDGCTSSTEFTRGTSMEGHLMTIHGRSKEEAKNLSECGWSMRLTNEIQEASAKRKYAPKPWQVRGNDNDNDDHDEDEEDEQRMTSAPHKRRKM